MPQQVDYTMRYKSLSGKVQYANRVVQDELVNSGRKLTYTVAFPDKTASILADIRDGQVVTTPSEVATYLAEISTPSATVPDPYASDTIYLNLTTSASAYRSATVGSWVAVTSAEYSAIQTNLTGVATAGTTTSVFNTGTYSGALTFNNLFTANASSALAPAIVGNTYIFGFAIIVRTPLTTTMNDIRVYTNSNTALYSGFSQLGSALPALVAGKNYFIRKGVSAINAATDGLLAITAPGDGTTSGQVYNLPYNSAMTGGSLKYNNGVTLPITLATNMLSTAPNWGFGIQALTSPTIQWVTS